MTDARNATNDTIYHKIIETKSVVNYRFRWMPLFVGGGGNSDGVECITRDFTLTLIGRAFHIFIQTQLETLRSSFSSLLSVDLCSMCTINV